jgi:hypothetical protein
MGPGTTAASTVCRRYIAGVIGRGDIQELKTPRIVNIESSLATIARAKNRAGENNDRCERGLADLERVTPQIIAIQLDQVEGVQEHVPVMLAVADTLERCEPVVIARDGFPIDDARP